MSAPSFDKLRGEYGRLIKNMIVVRTAAVRAAADKLLRSPPFDRHERVALATGVPHVLIATLDMRESDCDPRAALGQGDPWNKKSTHIPRGFGPFKSWEDAAKFYIDYDNLDDIPEPWSLELMAYKGEAWNGWGVRNHGRWSGYLWSGTQHYDPPTGKGGKYVSDGVWSSTTVDQQLGIMPVALEMISLRPSLGDVFGAVVTPKPPPPEPLPPEPPKPPPPAPGPSPYKGVKWIQHSLNVVLQLDPPIPLTGNYGKMTRDAVRYFQWSHGLTRDGEAGAETCAKIDEELAKRKK